MSGTPAGVGPQPHAGSTWLAATATGAYRSADNGVTWTSAATGLLDTSNRITLAHYFFRTSTGRILRGADNSSWDNRIGSPLWYSDDDGLTWSESLLPFGSVATNPAGIGFTGFTAYGGAIFAAEQLSQGVWKSTDNGITWTAARAGIPTTLSWPFQATVMSGIASNAAGLYATGIALGIYRSTDGGANWSPAGNGLGGAGARDIVALDDGTLFACVQDAHVFRSTDNGDSWVNVSALLGQGSVRNIATDGTKLYAFTQNQVLLESVDGGNSFAIVNGGTPPPLRTSNLRQLAVNANTALYSSNTEFWRLDLSTAPRVAILPAITSHPLGKGVNAGGTLTLSVAHSNATQPINYVWKNGTTVVGGNSPTLVISPVSLADAGNYTVEITNGAGTATSNVAAVVVGASTPGSIDYTIQPVAVSSNVFAVTQGLDGSVWFGGQFLPAFPATLGRRVTRILPDGTIDPAFVPTSGSINSEFAYALHPLPDGGVLVGGGTGNSSSQYFRKLGPNGQIDGSFDWPNELGGRTYAIVAGPDGTSYVGGTYGVYRIFNATGAIDWTFNPPNIDANREVRSIAIDAGGNLVIGGSFQTVNGLNYLRIARLLDDGTLDTTFHVGATLSNNGFNGDVMAVAVQADGQILAAGNFTNFRGAANSAKVARVNPDGTHDASLVPPVFGSGNINAMVLDGAGGVLVGGAFTQVNGAAWNTLVRLDAANGAHDTSFPAPASNAAVQSLFVQPDGRVLVGTANSFTRLLGHAPTTPRIASFSPDSGAAAGQPASMHVTLAGPAAGATYKWYKDGVLLPAEMSATLGRAALSTADNGSYRVEVTVGSTVLKSPSSRLDVLGAPVFTRLPDPAPGFFGYRHFLTAKAVGRGPLSYQWLKEGSPINGQTGPGLSFASLVAADAANYSLRVTGPDGVTESTPFYLAVLPRLGQPDPSFRLDFTPQPSTPVGYSAVLPLADGKVLLGGTFQSTATGYQSLLRLFPDGTVDLSFNGTTTGITGVVRWLYRQSSGKIIVGSDKMIVRLMPNLAPDPSFTFPSLGGSSAGIQTMTLLADDRLLVQGNSGASVAGYASKLFRTTVDGAIDNSFTATAITPVASVTALGEDADGNLLLGGNFTAVGGQSRNKIAQLLPTGELDTAFTGPGIFNDGGGVVGIQTILEGPDGDVYIGSDSQLTKIGNAPAGHIARFDGVTGAHDPTFYPSSWGGSVHALRFMPDGRIAVAGNLRADLQNNRTVFEVRFPNGARDRSGLGILTGHSSAIQPATALVPSLTGRDLLPGEFVIPDTPLKNTVRFFTSVAPLAFVTQPSLTASTPALPNGTPANTAIIGTNITLGAIALGTTGVSYQWYFEGQPIAGATSASLVRNPVQKTHEGSYTVVATNASGSQTSLPVYLDVLAEPEILTHPVITATNVGGAPGVTLSVTAKGRPTMTYAWTKDGAPVANVANKITGATTATLTILNVSEADAGAYRAVVTNSSGSTPSNPADLVPVTSPGSVDPSWAEPYPFVDTSSTDHPLRLFPASDGGFFLGAKFYNFQGITGPRYAARYTAAGSRVTTFAPGTNPALNTAYVRWALHPSDILYATQWATSGGTPTLYRFNANGTTTAVTPTAPGSNLPSFANDIYFEPSGKLIVASAASTSGKMVRRYTVDTTANTITEDPTFNSNINNHVYGVYPSPATGGYYIAGGFTQVDGTPRAMLARLTSTGALDTTFTFDTSGQSGYTYMTAPFVLEAPSGMVHFRNLRLSSTGARDNGWNSSLISLDARRGVFSPDGKLLVANRNTVTRIRTDGTLDPAFVAPVFTGTIDDLVLTPSGQLYAGGNFNSSAATYNRVDLVRLYHESTDIGFTTVPADQTIDTGSGVTFTAAAYGTGVTYKWYHRGVLVANGGRYSGATTGSLTMTGATEADAGSFRVEISNTAGTRSRTAFLTVNPPPSDTFATWPDLATVPAHLRGPDDDPDGDGLKNILEYALALPPGTPGGNPTAGGSVSVSGQSYPAITFVRRKSLPDVTLTIQATADLSFTDGIGTAIVSTTDNGDGTETVVARSTVPRSAASGQFLRVKVESL